MTDISPLRGDESGDLIVRIPLTLRTESESWELPQEYHVLETGQWELLAHTLPANIHALTVNYAGAGDLAHGDHNLDSLIRDTAVYDEATDTHTIPQPPPTEASEAHRLRAALEEVRNDLDGLWVNAGEDAPVGVYLRALYGRVNALLGTGR